MKLAWLLLVACLGPAQRARPPAAPQLIIVVLADDWSSTSGSLRRFERAGSGWRPVGATQAVSLGQGGLGWGEGMQGQPGDPVKHEGDGKTPAGIFTLSQALGRREQAASGLPYRQIHAELRCVDDPASQSYDRIVDRGHVQVDWNSAEEMARSDGLYDWVLVIDHNPAHRPGLGSCVFFHVWRQPGAATVGCVAMPAEVMEQVIAWARPGSQTVILPRRIYLELQEKRQLPPAW